MSTAKAKSKKKSVGRPLKPESEKLVILGGKVPPEVRVNIEEIAQSRGWTISGTVCRACEMLIQAESRQAQAA